MFCIAIRHDLVLPILITPLTEVYHQYILSELNGSYFDFKLYMCFDLSDAKSSI